MSKQVRADGILILVTLCWGVSYLLMDISLEELDPFTLNAFRFLGAFAIAALVSFKKIRTVNKTTLKYSLLVGFALVFVYIGATFGVKYTSLSNSGFLCALTVVFTPILAWLFFKKAPGKKLTFVVILCFIGIALLTLGDDFSINMEHLKGDLLCLMCAVAYAADLLLTEKAVSHEEVDAYNLEYFSWRYRRSQSDNALIVGDSAGSSDYGGLERSHLPVGFLYGVAFVLQPVAQQYTTASHVGVIFTLEPVFAAVVAYFFAGEILSFKAYLGAALMLASIFIMEIDFKTLKKKKKAEEV